MATSRLFLRIARSTTALTGIAMSIAASTAIALDSTPAKAYAVPGGYSIPAGSVASALNRLADLSGAQLVYDARLTRQVHTRGVSGEATLEGALNELLKGTGLTYSIRPTGTSVAIVVAQNNAGAQSDAAVPRGATALPTIEVGAAKPTRGVGTPSAQGQAGVATTGAGQSGGGGAGGGAGGYGGAGAAQDPYNKSYVLQNTSTGTKTDTPVMDTPLNVQSVSQQVLQDQQVTNLAQAVQNVSGVIVAAPAADGNISGAVGNGIFLRGFETSSYFRDGFRVDSTSGQGNVAQRQFANIANVEVLKGPGAILYGFSDPGGVVNIVTKQPLDQPYYAAQTQVGSLAFYRTTVDATGPLNADKSLLYRINMSYENNGAPYDSIIDRTGSQSIFVAPVVKWNVDAATWANLEAEYNEQRQRDAYSAFDPVVNGVFVNLPRNFNYVSGFPYTQTDLFAALTWSHQFDKDWSIKQQIAYDQSTFLENAILSSFPLSLFNSPFPSVQGGAGPGTYRSSTYSTDVDITGHANTFGRNCSPFAEA